MEKELTEEELQKVKTKSLDNKNGLFRPTNVFQIVIGSRRAQRKRDFMVMFDSIASVDENERLFYEIIEAAGKFMEMNNKILLSVQQRPWWMYYVWAGTAIATALWVSFFHFKPK